MTEEEIAKLILERDSALQEAERAKELLESCRKLSEQRRVKLRIYHEGLQALQRLIRKLP